MFEFNDNYGHMFGGVEHPSYHHRITARLAKYVLDNCIDAEEINELLKCYFEDYFIKEESKKLKSRFIIWMNIFDLMLHFPDLLENDCSNV